MKIEIGKMYTTVCGEIAQCTEIGLFDGTFACHIVGFGDTFWYTPEGKVGRADYSRPYPYDIVFEEIKYRRYK